MKFGYLLAGQFLPGDDLQVRIRESLEQVRAARKAGFHSIWVTHHFLAEFQFLQPLPFLARLLAEAEGMHIGTCVLLATMYPPVLLAEEIATLDNLCGGRFIFGAGTGYRDEEFQAFGIDRKTRMERFDEVMHLCRSLWSGKVVNHVGKFFKLEGAQLRLCPPQGDAIPIWNGATGPLGIKHAARTSDDWLISPELPMDKILEKKAIYCGALPQGTDPKSKIFPLLREVFAAKDHDTAQKIAAPALRTKYEMYARWGHEVGTLDDMLQNAFMLGSAEHCIAEVAKYREQVGTRLIITRMQWPGLDQADVLRSIETFARVIEHGWT